jgi:hypothetical protein
MSDVQRPTKRRLLAAIGVYLLIAIVASIAIGSARDQPSTRGAEWSGLIIVVGLLGFLAFAIYRIRVRPRMTAGALEASGAGLRHSAKDRLGLRNLPFGLLARVAPPATVGNVIWGRWQGMNLTLFDLWSAGRQFGPPNEGAGAYRCVVMPFPAGWPDIVVEPERLTSQIPQGLSPREIQFESEEFNRRFEVRCADQRFAIAVLDGRMITWLLSLDDGWGFETHTGRLLAYAPLQEGVDPLISLEVPRAFLEHVPEVVYSLFPAEIPAAAGR